MKKIEKEDAALREECRQLRTALDSLQSAVWLMDPQMRVLRANGATRSIFGFDPARIVGRHCWELAHGTSEPLPTCPVVRAMESRVRETETQRIGDRWFAVTGVPVIDDRGALEGIVHIVDDITERDHAAAETRALLRATREIVVDPDFAKVSRAVLEICREVIGAGTSFVSPPDAIPPVFGRVRDAALRTGRAVFDNEIGSGDAAAPRSALFAPMRASGVTVGTIGLADRPGGFDKKDARLAEAFGELLATAHQRSEAAGRIAESESRFRLLAENVSDVIWTSDLALLYTYVSPSHERSSGYSVAESMGKRADAILTPASAQVVAAALAEELEVEARGGADPKRTRHLELEQINKDGSTIWTEVNASFLRGEDGRPIGILGVSRDVTEKRRLQASLSQADRLASMGMLAAGVAHEINNPLAYVLYNVESLAQDLPRLGAALAACRAALEERFGAQELGAALGDHERLFQPATIADLTDRLRDALSGADRVKAIVRGIGTFSRVDRSDVGPTDVRPAIEQAANMARNEIRYRARLVTEYGDVPQVIASDGKLAQVVLNLLLNAAQAIDEGGVDRNEIRVRSWADGGGVFVEVRDTGKGIPRENLGRIFEPFFTTKPIGVGSGLGLSICRKIVEEFGGEIGVESEVGVGTRFAVRLPAVAVARDAGAEEARAASSPPPHPRGRIFLVDDDVGIRKAVARVLGGAHEVVTAASGEEAKAILGADSGFDLLLFDVMMPTVTGMDLHAWLHARNPALAQKVVFFTGGVFTPRANEYLAQVGNLRLEKPFDVAQLQKVVAGLVRAAKAANQSPPAQERE